MSINVESDMQEYLKIDKISDDVYVLAPTVILKFNVSLSKISGGKRYHYHKEYEYGAKGLQQQSLVTIKRSFDYYLSFESAQKDESGNKLFIRIGPQEYFLLKNGLEEVKSWFTDTKYSNLFATDRGKLIMMPPIPSYRIHSLPMQKYIEFTPTIIDRGIANADKEPGIKIEFGDPDYTVCINLDKFMGLYYTISCFNMYQAAATLVNYNTRPNNQPINRFVMDNAHSSRELPSETTISGASGVTGRQVTPKGIKQNISLLEG